MMQEDVYRESCPEAEPGESGGRHGTSRDDIIRELRDKGDWEGMGAGCRGEIKLDMQR